MNVVVLAVVLVVVSLAFVLYPIFRSSRASGAARSATDPPIGAAPPADDPEESALQALEEIEFDHAMGKLSDADYAALKARYARLAEATRHEATAAPVVTSHPAPPAAASPADAAAGPEGSAWSEDDTDAVEAAVRRYRAARERCPSCGEATEPDARFCSSCGARLGA